MRTGLSNQISFGEETTWGTPVTPTFSLPIAPADNKLAQTSTPLESKGQIAGQSIERSSQWSPGNAAAGGAVGFELFDRSLSVLFKHMFGTTAGSGPYTFTPIAGSIDGKGLTIQTGISGSTAGVVSPLTYSGCKIKSWEIGCAQGAVATLGLDIVARQEIDYRTVADGVTTNTSPTVTSATMAFTPDDVGAPISGTGIPASSYVGVWNSATSVGLSSSPLTNTPVNATATGASIAFTLGLPLASASYTSGIGIGMSFVGAYVTVAGAALPVTNMTIKGDNGLNERRFTNTRFISEPLEAKRRMYSGQLDTEFFDMTAYRRFRAKTESALVLNFAAGSSTLAITTNVRYDGQTPTGKDGDTNQQSLPYVCVASSTDASAITAVLSTA